MIFGRCLFIFFPFILTHAVLRHTHILPSFTHPYPIILPTYFHTYFLAPPPTHSQPATPPTSTYTPHAPTLSNRSFYILTPHIHLPYTHHIHWSSLILQCLSLIAGRSHGSAPFKASLIVLIWVVKCYFRFFFQNNIWSEARDEVYSSL